MLFVHSRIFAKTRFLVCFIMLLLLSLSTLDQVGAFNFTPEKIEEFNVQVDIQKDSSFLVKESIVYNFGSLHRHGIYRIIPTKGIRISKINLFDDQGQRYKFTVSQGFGSVEIKIGDPQKLITGRHTYNIVYRVEGGVLFFKDHDELYWNVTGNEWKIPIEKATAVVRLPEETSQENLKFACYTGFYGSKASNCDYFVNQKGEIEFSTTKSLSSYEGLTIVLGFPKGTVKEPGFWQKLISGFQKYWPFLIPLAVFIYLFWKWFKYGRDPKIKKAIVPQYEPPDDLRPAQIKAILKQKLIPRDLAATLIDLAVRGYIKIRELKKEHFFSKKDYELIRLKPNEEDSLLPYEKKFLEIIFGVKEKIRLSEVRKKNTQGSDRAIYNKCFQKLTEGGYFSENPQKVFNRWVSAGIVVIILPWVLLALTDKNFDLIFVFWIALAISIPLLIKLFSKKGGRQKFSLTMNLSGESFFKIILAGLIFAGIYGMILFLFSFISSLFSDFLVGSTFYYFICAVSISGVLFLIFARIMPKKTKKGADAYWKILGFRDFIKTAEKYRAQFYEKENIFEEYLPYAIIFGLTDKWAKAFEGIYQKQPDWYEGRSFGTFSTVAFVSSLNSSLSHFNSAFASSAGAAGGHSGLGGGGFSGGGFGGGGGGSW